MMVVIVGLTGGIATGKSTTSKYLASKPGIAIVDADEIAKRVVEPGTTALRKIHQHFGMFM